MIFPQRAVIVHESNRLGAFRDLRVSVAIESDVAEQGKELVPWIGLLPLRKARSGRCRDQAAAAPWRWRPPQLVDVATSNPRFEQFERRLHGPLDHVSVVGIPTRAHARMIRHAKDAMDIDRKSVV